MQVALDPFNSDGVTSYNRIRVVLLASEDGSFPELKYSLWVNEFDKNFDWTKWHQLEVVFRDGKAAILLDGNTLSENKKGAIYWHDVRTDIPFNRIRVAHRRRYEGMQDCI